MPEAIRVQTLGGQRACQLVRRETRVAQAFVRRSTTGRCVSIESEPSISPVSTSIASIAPAGTGSPFSNRSTENDLASPIEPVIATRIEPMRIVRAVTGLSAGVEATSLAGGAGEGGGAAAWVDAAAAGGADGAREEKGGMDEISAASIGGMDPDDDAGAADDCGGDSGRALP